MVLASQAIAVISIFDSRSTFQPACRPKQKRCSERWKRNPMKKPTDALIKELSGRLDIDQVLLERCVKESVVEIRETEQGVERENGTLLRVRRLERSCRTFDVEPS